MLDWIHGRWNENPQPLSSTPQGTQVDFPAVYHNRRLAKLFPSEGPGHIDNFPYAVAFTMKRKGDAGFYHFNDESYVDGMWGAYKFCRQDRCLGPGLYRLDVRLTGYGLLTARTATFRLRNSGTTHDDLVLEPWSSQIQGKLEE